MMRIDLAKKEHFDLPTGPDLLSQEPGRYDFAVVNDDEGLGREIRRNIPENVVRDPASSAVDDQEPGVFTMLKGILGDTVFGKCVIEVGEIHRKDVGHWTLDTRHWNKNL
jgi:hypothetical protein